MDRTLEMLRAELYVVQRICSMAVRANAGFITTLGFKVRQAWFTQRQGTMFAGICVAGFVLTYLWADVYGDQIGTGCPAVKPQWRHLSNGPSSLLERLRKETNYVEQNALIFECAHWKTTTQYIPLPLEEIRAQLECHSILIRDSADVDSRVDLASFLDQARAALGAVRKVSKKFESMKIQFSALSQQGAVPHQLKAAMIVLGGLAGFEQQNRDALDILALVVAAIEQHQERWTNLEDESGEEHPVVSEAINLRTALRRLLLKSVRAAYLIAEQLPPEDPSVEHVQRCRPDLLAGLYDLALSEAKEDTDFGVMFDAGHLLSDVSMVVHTVPLFGVPKFVEATSMDAEGFALPHNMVLSELMLLAGFGGNQSLRAAPYVNRIMQHAHHLSVANPDAAAQRYRHAAQTANNFGHSELAASAMAYLSYMLSNGGLFEDALVAADHGIAFGNSSLASYLQVSLKLHLGMLHTDADIHQAKYQLKSVQGHLEPVLEEECRTTLDYLEKWGAVVQAGTFSACLRFVDVAHLLVCFLSKLAYM